jgi:hypothetical protein
VAKGFVGGTTGTAINGGNVTLTLTSGLAGGSRATIAKGDLVLVWGCMPGNGAASWPGDWETLNNGLNGNNTSRNILAAKKIGDTLDTNVTFTADGLGTSSVGAIAMVFSAADLERRVAITTATGNTTDPNPPAITPSENASGVVCFASQRVDDAAITVPTNYVNLVFVNSNGDTNDIGLAGAWRDGRNGGASEDPPAFTGWLTGQWRAVTVVIVDAKSSMLPRRDPMRDHLLRCDRRLPSRRSSIIVPRSRLFLPRAIAR